MAAADILLSGAKLYYAPTGESLPDETSVGYGTAWGGNWTAFGFTSSPLTAEYFESRTPADEQQYLAPIKDWIVEQRMVLRTEVSEYTGDNLALLLTGTNADTAAGASQKGYSRVTFGGDPIVIQKAVGFEGYRPDSAGTLQPVRWFFFVASLMLDRGVVHSKRDKSALPIMVNTYTDTSKAVGQQLGEIHIVTAPAS